MFIVGVISMVVCGVLGLKRLVVRWMLLGVCSLSRCLCVVVVLG